MGYTHYWEHGDLDQEIWNSRFVPAVTAILDDSFCPLLADAYGEPGAVPEVSSERIAFNGVGEQSHESFILTPTAKDFDFCKTAQKPYDAAVVAVLMLADELFPNFKWSSDGEGEDFRDGISLKNMALTPNKNQ